MKCVALSSLSAALTALSLSANAAFASVITFGSDAAFIPYQTAGRFSKTFGADVRWGDALPVGD